METLADEDKKQEDELSILTYQKGADSIFNTRPRVLDLDFWSGIWTI